MFPFIEIFGKKFPLYGILWISGAAVGIGLACFRAGKKCISREDVVYTALFCLIGGIIGGKLLYIVTLMPRIFSIMPQTENPLIFVLRLFSDSGMVFYGSVLGAFVGGLIYVRKYKLDFLQIADLLAPSAALGHGIGRVGCFMAGCCFGIPSKWGIVFHKAIAAPNEITLLPVQLIEAVFLFLLCIGLIIYDARKSTQRQTVFYYYLLFYSMIRFVLEFFRGDTVRGIYFGISTSQYISIGILTVTVILLVRQYRNSKQKSVPQMIKI